MLNGAWPNLHWSLFDYYLKPMGSTFGTKVGTRVEHVAYDYKENALYIINHSLVNSGNRSVSVDVVDIDGNSLGQEKHSINTEPNASRKIVDNVTGINKTQDVAFLKLELRDGGKDQTLLSRNVYWVSPKLDVLDWDHSTWYHTPVTSYSDLTALNDLDPASVKLSVELTEAGGNALITLENESDVPAFFLRLNALDSSSKSGGGEIAPIFWSDNYVTLFPHETLELSVEYPGISCSESVAIEVTGFNVEKATTGIC
jgi:exo-1,4-beta-D-glucosaminidase